MKYVLYILRALVPVLFGLSIARPEGLTVLFASALCLAGYEILYAIERRYPVSTLDTKALIEKVEALERDFSMTKDKISALSMSAGLKPQTSKNPFIR